MCDDYAGDARQGPPSVVERLEERRRIIAERSTDLDRILTALRPLYASFTADQRRTADRLMFQPGGERGRGGYDDNSRDGRGSGAMGVSIPATIAIAAITADRRARCAPVQTGAHPLLRSRVALTYVYSISADPPRIVGS